MSIFTFVLDASFINTHAVLSAISAQDVMILDLVDFKIYVINQLIVSYIWYISFSWTICARCKIGRIDAPKHLHHAHDISSQILFET